MCVCVCVCLYNSLETRLSETILVSRLHCDYNLDHFKIGIFQITLSFLDDYDNFID